jgi:hypothetical protein
LLNQPSKFDSKSLNFDSEDSFDHKNVHHHSMNDLLIDNKKNTNKIELGEYLKSQTPDLATMMAQKFNKELFIFNLKENVNKGNIQDFSKHVYTQEMQKNRKDNRQKFKIENMLPFLKDWKFKPILNFEEN